MFDWLTVNLKEGATNMKEIWDNLLLYDYYLFIFLIKIAKFSASSAFVNPFSPSVNGPSYKLPETLITSL